jgi:hypothetical protein
LAWTYYEAVHEFGSVVVDIATIDRYGVLKAQAEARHAAAVGAN